MSFMSVWGFDPDEVNKAQSPFRREANFDESDADESMYDADEQQAAHIPTDVDSQILELLQMFR